MERAIKPEASVLIPTRNPGEPFGETLKAVFSQKGVNFEVLVLDTESNDSTVETAKRIGASVIGTIKQSDFSHGKARNLLAKAASGEFLVFLTQDAVPASNNWLKKLVSAFSKNEKIAGVYGRQLAKKNASLFEKAFYAKKYSQAPVLWDSENWLLENVLFSNVNAAVPKKLFLDNLFSEKTIVSEDYDWALRMLEKGYSIAYAPEAAVWHSHNFGLWQTFQRHFDIGYSYWQILNQKRAQYNGNFFLSGIRHYSWFVKNSQKDQDSKQKFFFLLPGLLLDGAAKSAGIFVGKKIAHFLPKKINGFFSAQKHFWG